MVSANAQNGTPDTLWLVAPKNDEGPRGRVPKQRMSIADELCSEEGKLHGIRANPNERSGFAGHHGLGNRISKVAIRVARQQVKRRESRSPCWSCTNH